MHKSVTNGLSPFNFHEYFNEVQQSFNSRSTVVQQSFNSRSTVVQQSFNSRSTVVQQFFAVFSLPFSSSATNNFIVERMLPHLILYTNVSTLSIISFFNAVTAVTITANTIVASALMLVWQYFYITFVFLTPLLF